MYWTILDNKLKVKLQPEAEKTIDIFSSPGKHYVESDFWRWKAVLKV